MSEIRTPDELDRREHAVANRERAVTEREQRAGEARDANEHLVLATMRAEQLAEEAQAARVAITASEKRFRSLVTASSAVVFTATADGRITVDAQSWTGFTGLTPDTRESLDWLQAVDPEDRDGVLAAWTRAVREGRVWTHQLRLRRRDGGQAWVIARAVPILEDGAVREWIGMMTDVSDRVRIEEAREQFIAILGHDLRTPLASILLGADALGRFGLPDASVHVVERIVKAARRMEAMIRDILDFARGRLGQGIPVTRIACDLGRICADAVAEARAANPKRSIVYERAGDLAGEWDPDRIEQVVSNLVGNAVHHGADPIVVSAQDAGVEVVVTVRNAGEPIPRELMPRLFEPFRRGSDTTSEGLGLGLYIVSEIVRAHGGTIAVTSRAGEGTAFITHWPRHGAA